MVRTFSPPPSTLMEATPAHVVLARAGHAPVPNCKVLSGTVYFRIVLFYHKGWMNQHSLVSSLSDLILKYKC